MVGSSEIELGLNNARETGGGSWRYCRSGKTRIVGKGMIKSTVLI